MLLLSLAKFVLPSMIIIVAFKKWQLLIPESFKIDSVEYISNFLTENGYSIKSYEVTTEDGYILTLHRIGPHGRSETSKNSTPVFLMHGIICTSFDWLVLGPGKALALILADAGYDVWLGNNRGNTFSRKHQSLIPEEPAFWNYSYHEIGIYDLPAMIDKILTETGRNKLTYVGFSEGFTSFVVMGSLRPEYNDKILVMNAFAPVTNMYQVKSPIINFLAQNPSVFTLLKYLSWNELLSNKLAPLFRIVCGIPGGDSILWWIFHLSGASHHQLDKKFLSTLFNTFPGGLSLKQLEHYVQGARFGYFRPYENINNKTPESYDLTKVTAPIIMYYGEDDYLVNNDILLNDVATKIPNVVEIYRVPYKDFNHVDFIWGNDISLLTDKTLENVKSYTLNEKK